MRKKTLGIVSFLLALMLMSGLVMEAALAKSAEPAAKPVIPKEKTEFGTAMSFTVIRLGSSLCEPNCPEWIAAEGEITEQTPGKLTKLLANPEYRKLPILLNSPGGRIYAAMAMGRMIRKYGMNTALAWSSSKDCSPLNAGIGSCTAGASAPDKVHLGYAFANGAYCNSACSWVLLAGVARFAGRAASIGVHQPHEDYTPWVDHYWDTWRVIHGKKHIISHRFVGRTYEKPRQVVGVTAAEKPIYTKYIKEMGGSFQILDEMNKASPKDLNDIPQRTGRRKELGLVTDNDFDAQYFTSNAHCKGADQLTSNCITLTPEALAALASPPPPPAPEPQTDPDMTFTLMRLANPRCDERCPEWIAAYGRITDKTPEKFTQFLANPDNRKRPILLWSHGGDFEAAMTLGRIIRSNGMNTIVSASTYEGCSVYAKDDKNCTLGQDAKLHPGFAIPTAGYCEDACSIALLAGTVRIASPGATVSLPYLSDDKRVAFEEYLILTGGTFSIVGEMDKELAQSRNISDQEQRAKLDLVSDAELTVEYLVGLDHCKTYGKLSANCIDTQTKEPLTAAAAKPNGENPSAMTFTVTRLMSQFCEPRCSEWIAASGLITPTTPAELEALLSDPQMRKLPVIINSKGGDEAAATVMGSLIRKYGMNTAIGGTTLQHCADDSQCGGTASDPRMGIPYVNPVSCDKACLLMLQGGKTVQLRDLISPEHCDKAGNFQSNCVDQKTKEPQKTAAP